MHLQLSFSPARTGTSPDLAEAPEQALSSGMTYKFVSLYADHLKEAEARTVRGGMSSSRYLTHAEDSRVFKKLLLVISFSLFSVSAKLRF